jgi:uncharacterized spore protein YtfJ
VTAGTPAPAATAGPGYRAIEGDAGRPAGGEEAEMTETSVPKTDVRTMIQQATDAMTVRRVFGEPYEKNGVTVIPAARVQGGAGGGEGEGPGGEGKGGGSGYALNAKPTGAFVIKGDDVVWRPAVDANRVILGAQIVAVLAILLVRTIVKFRTATALAEMKTRS